MSRSVMSSVGCPDREARRRAHFLVEADPGTAFKATRRPRFWPAPYPKAPSSQGEREFEDVSWLPDGGYGPNPFEAAPISRAAQPPLPGP